MHRNKVFAAMLAILMVVSLTACGWESVRTPGGELENGVAAIENAMTTKPNESSSASTTPIDDLRNGSSTDTVATPGDFPDAYNFGSGKISDYSRTAMLQKMPEPAGNNTVLNTAADPANIQVLYLWEEGNVPGRTKFTQDMTGYFDDWNFRPYVTAIPVREGVKPKGAVVLMAGGIQAGEFLMHYDEDVTGTALDSTYVPDELDAVLAYASAAGMIYSFYGRLSVGNMDASWLTEGDLPPTFYVYGTEDPFYRQFQQQYDVISGMGISTGRIVLNGWPHGFGSDGGWVKNYAAWLETIFA